MRGLCRIEEFVGHKLTSYSDIVAELPCPHSGILTLEDGMPHPNLQAARDIDGLDSLILESYTAQLYLRKHLNTLHNMFYNPEGWCLLKGIRLVANLRIDSQGDKPNYFATIEACEGSLSQIDIVAPNMRWEEDDPPATDILGARLRAKFYGARVITYRDFVLKILEHSAANSKFRGQQISKDFKSGVSVPTLKADMREIDPKILQYAEMGIKSLIKSTTAFYGLGDPGHKRLIVTNIWGTAHAYVIKIRLLVACY